MSEERYKDQIIITDEMAFLCVKKIIKNQNYKNIFVVCSESARKRYNMDSLSKEAIVTFFHAFSVNPKYEEVVNGLELFQSNGCDAIISVGGGSAIDVAKCMKAFFGMDTCKNYLHQQITQNSICHIAMPTTAGTGSESTSFAVIYYQGEKKSIANETLLPDYAVLCPRFLETLPDYQRKVTVLDALCQGIESYWSLNATEESRRYAREAIEEILQNVWQYIEQCERTEKIMYAANLAGRAINISKTTAAHAMSYKITSLYGLPHGHAVALCLPETWRFMNMTIERSYGKLESLNKTLQELAGIMGANNSEEAEKIFEQLLERMGLRGPKRGNESEIDILVRSVNTERLQNFPVYISEDEIKKMYQLIVK